MRYLNVLVLVLVLAGGVFAEAIQAPLTVVVPAGGSVFTVGADGIAYSRGIAVTSSDQAGSLAIAAATAEVTKTFTIAEADTNYYIVGTQSDVTAGTTATMFIKRKNVGSFVVGSTNVNSSTAYFTWIKVRY